MGNVVQNDTVEHEKLTQQQLADLVIETEAGARSPTNPFVSKGMIILAFVWSVFQLIVASPMSTVLNLNGNEIRYIHLAFALILCFLAYPATSKSPRSYVPFQDWIFAIVSSGCALYLFVFSVELSGRPGAPIDMDIYVGCAGIALLLEAARRALGLPLVIIATIFITYTLFGSADFVPDVIRHKGQSLNKTVSHQWLTTEGVFGIAIGVSSGFVFMFVLFGALLDKAGAGNYFIKLAFSLLGHMRGGPAKAAVASSAMMGMVSGSSIASTVTIGTFTIPLMKRVGFTGVKAGAVEVASAVNAQIMPPVMGAAAFLIAEYIGISFVEVIRAAAVPAIISYIALFYIVHLEAVKADMKSFEKATTHSWSYRIFVWMSVIIGGGAIAALVYYGINGIVEIHDVDGEKQVEVIVGGIKHFFGEATLFAVLVIVAVTYICMVKFTTRYPEIEPDDPNAEDIKLAETGPTFKAGLHYLLPIFVLVWCLMVERLSPGLSAFWASVMVMFMLPTQHVLKAYFRRKETPNPDYKNELKKGVEDLNEGMIMGARNMIGVAIATATAGIIVGTVSLTGVGQVLTEVVEIVAGDSIFLILLMTAVISLILGMGLPTTANYIVVASLMTHVVVQLGEQNGLVVPLIAVHLFVFYFGIMADITPPVGLASFAAAAISGADPIKTGMQGFTYALRTAILPFFFIFDNEILLIGVETIPHGIWVFVKCTVALLVFSAAMQNYFIVKSKAWETVSLLLVTFMLFLPQFWVNMVIPPHVKGDHMNLVEEIQTAPIGSQVALMVRGINIDTDKLEKKNVYITVDNKDGQKVIDDFGLVLRQDGKKIIVDDIGFNSKAEKAGIDFDYEVVGLELPQEQPSKNYAYIPAFLLLIIVFMSQTVRRRRVVVTS